MFSVLACSALVPASNASLARIVNGSIMYPPNLYAMELLEAPLNQIRNVVHPKGKLV